MHIFNGKKAYLGAIISGLLLTGAFPGLEFWWLAWFAMVPLLASIHDKEAGSAFRIGFSTGLIHYLTLLYWLVYTMEVYGGLPAYLAVPTLFLLAAYLSLWIGLFSSLVSKFSKKNRHFLFAVPVFWVSVEYIRGFLFTGFPWGLLGYSQAKILRIIQISDIFGVYGVSFLLVLSNAAIFLLYRALFWKRQSDSRIMMSPAVISVILSIGLILAAWFYGMWRIDSLDSRMTEKFGKRVTVVQGNIDQAIKWDPTFQVATVQKYIRLSLSAIQKSNPNLIVWPETATPFYFVYNKQLSKIIFAMAKETGKDFLIGSPSFRKNHEGTKYYNSSYLVNSEGEVTGKYDKVHLVPFGEYVPLKNILFFVGKMVEQVGDFKAGEKGNTLAWDGEQLGIQICFEIIFPSLSRAMVKNDATVLINITNDAWFGTTWGPYQHFSMAVFRAVENRRFLVRSANTGISGFVDPVGRVINSTALLEDAVASEELFFLRKKSIYTQFGDFFAHLCAAISAIILIIWMVNAKTKKKEY